MKKKLLIFTSTILLGLGLASCSKEDNTTSDLSTTTPSETTINTTSTPSVTTNANDDKFTYEGYYSSINDTVLSSKDSLRTTLNKLVTTDSVKKFSYSVCTGKLKEIDSYDGDYVECIYTGERIDKDNSGSARGAWNKEHIWAKSHGFNVESLPAYSDLHHLRVSESSINGARSDSYFDEITSSSPSSDVYGNKWTDNVFEPRDEVKGDVARMLLYMDIRYDESPLNLILTDDKTQASIIKNDSVGYMGLLSTILKWNFEDPVDSRELHRNEKIFAVQKNRNPFIDHPELAYFLFKDECQAVGITNVGLKDKLNQTLKDDTKIEEVNQRIKAIGTVTIESDNLIKSAEEAYNKLDSESKSFVTEYDTLILARYRYEELKSYANQDTTISTTFDLKPTSAKEGEAVTNGVSAKWKAPYVYEGKGIYTQNNKNTTIKLSNLYDAVKKLEFTFTSNKDASFNVIASITITDGTNSATGKSGVLVRGKTDTVSIDITNLDLSKEITITISSPTSSILEQLKLSVI